MKKTVVAVIFVILGLVPGQPDPAMANKSISASISSQIHDAFGREILDVFEKATGIKVKSHIFPSEKAIKRLQNGVTDIAGSTLMLSKKDRDSGLIEIPICRDSLVIITHPDVQVPAITKKQARDLFGGHIQNWKELGGPDKRIIRIIPASYTGAHKNFKRQVMGPFELEGDLIATQSATAVIGVQDIPGAVSFISNGIALKYKTVPLLKVDGHAPTDPDYPFHQLFSMVIKGKPDPAMREVIKFLTSDAAVNIMKENGLEPIFKK